MTQRRVLSWKHEDGPEDALDGSPLDVGPAWIDTYENDKHVSGQRIGDGKWLTRAEAQQLAAERGYEFVADDLGGDEDQPVEDHLVDLVSLNAALRAADVTEDELKVERIGNSYAISGSRAESDEEKRVRANAEFTFRTLRLARDEKELIEILSPLAPELYHSR